MKCDWIGACVVHGGVVTSHPTSERRRSVSRWSEAGGKRLHQLVRCERRVEMRDRRPRLDRVRRVHPHVPASRAVSQPAGGTVIDLGARPVEVRGVDRRGGALGVRHRRPDRAGAVVLEELHVRVVAAHQALTVRRIDERQHAEPVGNLMQNRVEVGNGVWRGSGADAVPPVDACQAARVVVDVAVELRADVGKRRVLIGAGETVRECSRVPGVGLRRAGKVAERLVRTGPAEHARERRAWRKRVHLRLDSDRDRAVEHALPDIGRRAERVEPLCADGSAGITRDRGDRSGVVEALTRSVEDDMLIVRPRARPKPARAGTLRRRWS